MANNKPMDMEHGVITEMMTDEEVSALDDSVECYLNGAIQEADFITATEIRRELWKAVWDYREALDEYYKNGGLD